MGHGVLTPRKRGVVGLTSLLAGAGVLVAAVAGPAAAHEGKEPVPIDETSNLSCAELAELFGIDADWTEFKIEAGDLPDEGSSQTYDLTPDDDGDDATVTITMVIQTKAFDWTSTVGIDAVYVKGGSAGSYFYGYQPDVNHNGEIAGPGEEATRGVDHGTPPWHQEGKNLISHVTFCLDDEHKPSPSSTTSTSSTASSSTTSTTAGDTTTSSTDTTAASTTTTPVVSVDTTAPPTVPVTTPQGSLPKTGADSTWLLLALGGVLVLGGGGLLASTRIARRRSG
jgi:LPXTG-motif cell wall-anchored protein